MATGIYGTFLCAECGKEQQRAAGAERSCRQGRQIIQSGSKRNTDPWCLGAWCFGGDDPETDRTHGKGGKDYLLAPTSVRPTHALFSTRPPPPAVKIADSQHRGYHPCPFTTPKTHTKTLNQTLAQFLTTQSFGLIKRVSWLSTISRASFLFLQRPDL